jgi:tRNA threonylcarbamoyl adenosine modification protein (Sua5/YciO/YrdC/YwlC family)
MTKILNTLNNGDLIDILQNGGVGVLSTDTVYGVVCRAADEKAVARLYALKNRENKPGTVIAASIQQLIDLGIKARYLKAIEQFWINGLSIEIPHSVLYLNQDTGRQAFRIVNAPKELFGLLRIVGPLLTSSANCPGEKPAGNIAEAQKYFNDQVDFYVDGGDLSDRKPSTLIRIVDDAVEVLRPGAVTIDETTGRIIN